MWEPHSLKPSPCGAQELKKPENLSPAPQSTWGAEPYQHLYFRHWAPEMEESILLLFEACLCHWVQQPGTLLLLPLSDSGEAVSCVLLSGHCQVTIQELRTAPSMHQVPDAEKSDFRVGEAQVQMYSKSPGTLRDLFIPSRRTSVKMPLPSSPWQPADQGSLGRSCWLDGHWMERNPFLLCWLESHQ